MIQGGITKKVELGELICNTVLNLSNKQLPRCMEHVVHLGAGHFIRVVSPTSARTLVKKFKKALRNGELDDDLALNADLGGNDDDDDDDDDDDSDDGNNGNNDDAASEAAAFTIGDTIGKSLALVKQVSSI